MDSKTNAVIANSPIEFVLVGPLRGRDKVLLSSDNAGLDLKGLAVGRDVDEGSLHDQSSAFSFFFAPSRQLNVLESYPIEDLDPSEDDRKSSFRFAWAGYCSSLRREKICSQLNRTIPDLRSALRDGESSDIELMVSPLILSCSVAHQRRLRSRRFMLATLVIYCVVGLSVGLFGLWIK